MNSWENPARSYRGTVLRTSIIVMSGLGRSPGCDLSIKIDNEKVVAQHFGPFLSDTVAQPGPGGLSNHRLTVTLPYELPISAEGQQKDQNLPLHFNTMALCANGAASLSALAILAKGSFRPTWTIRFYQQPKFFGQTTQMW